MFIGEDVNKRVRKVNAAGIITTYAGNGMVGWSGDGGLATAARCAPTACMCTDALGNLYFVDGNSIVRKVNTTGIISTVAGDTLSYIYNGDGIPATSAQMAPGGIILDNSGILYISDYNNNRIRKIDASGIIHTIAGTGIAGFSGDGETADSAEIYYPSGLAFDVCGNLYLGQTGNPCIRKVTFDTSCHIHAAQTGTSDTTKTGITNIGLVSEIKLYPNPAGEVLHIDVVSQMQYRIIDIVGSVLQRGDLRTGSNFVNIQSLPNGMYVLELSGMNGRLMRKVLKQ